RPFLFLIRDKTTGSLLFIGRVAKPAPLEEAPPVVDPELIRGYFGEGAVLEDGWWDNTVIGRFRTDYWPWLEHASLGWLYLDSTSADPAFGYWMYDFNLGWLYTSPIHFPYLWCESNGWLYYWPGTTGPRWFFRYSDNVWIN
ncbi:MAG TPA: hypothetical protein VK995_02525, partial [Oceanipulchritudo sp.]|nr:hypothetical protein [Oceanipulchritudo sp.]